MNNTVTFTLFRSACPMSKRYTLEPDGTISKAAAAQMTEGEAVRVSIPFEDLNDFFSSLPVSNVTGYGVMKGGMQKAQIVTGTPRDGQITRSKECMVFEAGTPGIFHIDHDPASPEHSMEPAVLWSLLCTICPELLNAQCLYRPSVSASVRKAGEPAKPVTRYHLYFLVACMADIPRFADALNKRLWLARYGYIALSKSGAMLKRSPIDMAVYSPERIDFTAPPILGEGLVCDKAAGVWLA